MIRAGFALTVLSVALVAALASTSKNGSDANKKQVLIKLRFCEADTGKQDDPIAVRVLSAPTVLVLEDQSATIATAGNLHDIDEQGQKYWQGIRATLTPRVADDGSITLAASCERSDPKLVEASKKPVKHGFALHTSTKVQPGEMAILGRSEAGGVSSWVEATCAVVTAKSPPRR